MTSVARQEAMRLYSMAMSAHEIDLDMLEEYVRKRRGKDAEHGGAKLHTIAKELITVRRACKHAVRHHVLPAMPAFPELGAKYVPKRTFLTADQFERMCAELEPDRRLWASIAALAGGCYGEVERVEWGNGGVDLVNGRIHLPGTKREARNRWVPIAPALRHRLEAVPERERRGHVVAHWDNVRRDLHKAVDKANKRAQDEAVRAGAEPPEPMPRVSPNDLRRTFGSWLVQQGVDTLRVAILMGHSSTRMVELVYGRLTKQNLETAIAVLPMFGKNESTKD